MAQDTPGTYPGFTNLALGEGVFDQLMEAARSHIEKEFKQQRISASDYSTVLLGTIESAMQNSTQYLLGLLLINEKQRGLDLANQKAEFEIDFMLPKALEKITAEISLIEAQKLLIDAQIEKTEKEIEYMTAKILTERANTEGGLADVDSLIGKQLALLTAQRIGFGGDIQLKASKMYSDFDTIVLTTLEPEGMVELPEDTQVHITAAEDMATAINAIP
jgi:hypothetical protein